MNSELSMLAMFLIGLSGAGHCVGMCGGISSALGLTGGKNQYGLLLGYQVGRILAYAFAGAIVGLLGLWGSSFMPLGMTLRIIAGVMLILMGFYVAGWWSVLTRLELVGQGLWRYLQPVGQKLLPVRYFHQACLLGFVWGWLPCGLVYSALAYAATASGPVESAFKMLAFGLGTAPAILFTGLFSGKLKDLLQRKGFRAGLAVLLVAFGVWTLWLVVGHLFASDNHAMHHHNSQSLIDVDQGLYFNERV